MRLHALHHRADSTLVLSNEKWSSLQVPSSSFDQTIVLAAVCRCGRDLSTSLLLLKVCPRFQARWDEVFNVATDGLP